MEINNIIKMPVSETQTPDQALESAKGMDLSNVIIIGVLENDEIFYHASRMTIGEGVYLLEKAKKILLD